MATMLPSEVRRFARDVADFAQRQPYPVLVYWSVKHGKAVKTLESRVELRSCRYVIGVYDARASSALVEDDLRAYLAERQAATA